MSDGVLAFAWPAARVGEAMLALCRAAKLGPNEAATLPHLDLASAGDRQSIGAIVEGLAELLRVEAEPVDAPYREVEPLLRGSGPALLLLPGDAPCRMLVLLGHRGEQLLVLTPEQGERRVPLAAVRAALCAPIEAPLAASVDRLLDAARVPPARRVEARAAMMRERLGPARIGGAWMLRRCPGAPLRDELHAARFGPRLVGLAAARVTEYGLGLLTWWTVGEGALSGRLDPGYLLAAGLLLLSQVPFRTLAASIQGRMAIDAGAILKRRLLAGALSLAPEEVRGEGAGALLGRVIESDAVESLSLGAGFEGLTALIELCVATLLLALGAGGGLSLSLLALWVALVIATQLHAYRRRRRWTEARVSMTRDLVERLVGHRTRAAQQPPERWHDGEDAAATRYLDLSRAMDGASLVPSSLLPRAFLVAGVAALAPSFVSGSASTASLALGLGATLLAYRAIARLSGGASSLAGAAIAWEKVQPLFDAAARTEPASDPLLGLASRVSVATLVDARELSFRYKPAGRKVLDHLSLQIAPGDRLLLEGSSGGGKSTLGALLAGLRAPSSGILLLAGLDRPTLGGAGFRRFVASAPQFHENHVLSGTFSFNLLMGRAWPPSPGDLQEALAICEELDLGPLLERMPAGLEQMVGETGWQLSHGEKSRLYIARALLQRAELVILDESFGALDPQTLERALRCVLACARTLLVIAHP
jgi:ATP-binding cassette subfamily B protein